MILLTLGVQTLYMEFTLSIILIPLSSCLNIIFIILTKVGISMNRLSL